MARDIVSSIQGEFLRYKALGEGTIGQLSEEELAERRSEGGNSVTTIVWHIAGNLKSRFTDFLNSDGEKAWRDRESEFQDRRVDTADLFEKWDGGWSTLLAALDELGDADLSRSVTIRGISLTVAQALHRSLAHTSYHIGQMVYLGKLIKGDEWTHLSIPPGQSAAYNRNPTLEHGPT